MTPSLPTFCIASAIILPIDLSPLAAIEPTCATSGFLDLLRTLGDVLHRLGDREVDAALEIHRVHARRDQLRALAHDRGGKNGGGGGAVAGGVVGLRGDFTHHLGAHILELVVELDLLGDGDAVLGDAGSAERLVDNDIAALRTEGHSNGVGENIDAAQHLLARVGGKTYVFSSHCIQSLEFREIVLISGGFLGGRGGTLNHAHDVGLLHDEEVFAVDLDLSAAPLAKQNSVAGLDIQRD